jgi:hypothetical protein
MISMKTNPKPAKLPVPPPRSQEAVTPFTPPPGTDPGPIPDSISRKKNPDLAARNAPTLASLAAKIADPEKRAAVEKIEAEKAAKRSTKRAVKKEVQKARAAGETAKMPLAGKDAVKALKAAAKANAKAEAKKAAPAKAAKAPKPGVGATAREAILAGKTNEQALAIVMKKHPGCNSNVGCVRWYRNELRKKGLLKGPAGRPSKAA